ncbi:phage major capsid protein [Syntrophomonas erecta subsp. sporosyntropha]
MNKEKYLADRKVLMDAAQALIDEGKLEEFEAKVKDVEALDAQFEAACKAQANLKALNDKTTITPLENKSTNIEGKVIENMTTEVVTKDNLYASVEYRTAFMRNVLAGEPIPANLLNTDANTKTTDVGHVIPAPVMEKIVEKMETSGMILPLVTRTSYKGGLAIPTSSVKPTATWVAEGASSDKQKKTTGSVTFNYYKLRCAVSVSLEVDTVTLAIFETTLINNVVEAMTKALEQAIISGTGGNAYQPLGILAETPATGQKIEITKANKVTYADLVAAEAALPLAYENGAVWFMTKYTFMNCFVGMVDAEGQPIARITYGIAGKPERTLLGRTVILNDYMDNYAAAPTAATTFAFLFNPKDYVLNTNLQMTIKKYEDNDTDDQVTKAIMLVDGKVVDKNSLVTLVKKAS